MSILNTTPTPQPSDAVTRKNRVIQIANQSARQLIQSVSQGIKTIWNSPNPADVLVELGTEAEATFDLSRDSIAFISTFVMGTDHEAEFLELVALVATIPPFTVALDGSVTID